MTTTDAHSASKRQHLPQTNGNGLFVTDGGLETELVFHDGIDLPCFAAFPLLGNPDTRARLRRYYDGYLDIARKHDAGFIVETPTWRANPDWAGQLGYSPEQLDAANRAAVALAEEVRTAAAADGITVGGERMRRPARRRLRPGQRDDARGGRALPRGADRHVRDHHGRPGHRDHDDQRRGGDRHRASRRRRRAFRRRSPSPSRPTGGFRPASRCTKRSNRSTRRPAPAPPTSWSTALTRRIFRPHWNTTGHGGNGWSACARTLPRRATPSSTRPPSSTREIRSTSAPSTPRCVTNCPPSGCSAAVAAPTPATWPRSSRHGGRIRLPRHPKKYRYLTAQVPLFVRCGGSPGVHRLGYMSENPNVTTVNKMTQAIINEDKETLTSLFADGFVFHMRAPFAAAGDHYGVDGLLGAIGAVFEATNGDVQLEQQFCIGTDGWVAEWEHAVLGRHSRTLKSDNAFVYRFAGNRIAEMWMFVGADPDAAASFFA